ncbi:type VI secretion system membrane subunit TssM [Gilvimarinus japonicus]|uniref:Type VI secretion system membrane subunit TssM n=1 Tax=Gilvimarinus japonicus TaxID=1796469 RepID=A0ABV7HJ12_9GAMM
MITRFFRFLCSRTFWVIVGIVAVILFIWFAGPLFAFSGWRPLSSTTVRWWCIGLLLAYFIIKLLIGFYRSKNINDKLLASMAKLKPEGSPGETEPYSDLQRNFGSALEHIKTLSFGRHNGLFSRFKRKYVYQLPWYVFIGAPGSGKTTALVNSGLRFPLLDVLGKESVKGVDGTRNCDWWFTEDAVFLDTAGRYTTQDSSAEADKQEWHGFLGLLRKFRPKQPLNGAIVTLSVADLLVADDKACEQQARQIRSRLADLTESLGVNFPVYVLLTKADLLGGFSDYFAGLSKEEREQVWGFTLPETQGGASVDSDILAREMLALSTRLFDGLPTLMLQEHDITRRAHAYAFAQNFANALPLARQVIEQVFYGSVLTNINFRGVYFASGTQEGTPFDRVLGALSRRVGVSSSININKNAASGKSYFIKDLINKVVLPEAHLAGRNRREERKELFWSVAGHLCVAGLLFVIGGLWFQSYGKNKEYVEYVADKNLALSKKMDSLSSLDPSRALEYLPVLDELLVMADGRNFSAEDPPLTVTLGLYQGEKLSAASDYVYRDALDRTLLPLVSKRLAFLLESSGEHDLGFSYQALKAYLMLWDTEHYDGEELLAFVSDDFQENLPGGVSPRIRESLNVHLANLLHESVVEPGPINAQLVERKRQLLGRSAFSQRAYIQAKGQLLGTVGTGFSFSSAAGPKSAFVFRRESGLPLSAGISELYTNHGYHKLFLPALSDVVPSMASEDSWVLGAYSTFGEGKPDLLTLAEQERAVKRLYLHEYVVQWEDYLADLRLVETHSMPETIEVARILSSVDSPLIQLLQAAVHEVNLGNTFSDAEVSVVKQAVRRAGVAVSTLERNLDGLATGLDGSEVLERIVDDRFKGITQLVSGQGGGSSSIDALLRMFNEVYISLSNTDYSIRSGSTSLGQSDAITQIRSEAARFPSPVRPVLEGLTLEGKRQAEGGIRSTLSDELNRSVGDFCRVAIRGRYPFDQHSTRDVTMADFSRMFAPSGMMDKFFNQHLRQMTDTTGRAWILRASTEDYVPIGAFQQAAKIRDVFFPQGASAPEISFDFKVLEMDAQIKQLTLDFDGQVFHYSHGPQLSRSVTWPGPRGGNQIRLELDGVEPSRRAFKVAGPWALMRLFQSSDNRSDISPEAFTSTVLVNGYKVVFEVTASSVNNPFYLAALDRFSCPSRI